MEMGMAGLFDQQEQRHREEARPLAARLRPRAINEFVGHYKPPFAILAYASCAGVAGSISGELLIHGTQLEDLEKLIDPFLSGDPRLVFRHVLTTVMDKDVPAIDESRKFAKPVNRKEYPQYYKMIKEPISIEEVRGVFFYKKKLFSTIGIQLDPVRLICPMLLNKLH